MGDEDVDGEKEGQKEDDGVKACREREEIAKRTGPIEGRQGLSRGLLEGHRDQ